MIQLEWETMSIPLCDDIYSLLTNLELIEHSEQAEKYLEQFKLSSQTLNPTNQPDQQIKWNKIKITMGSLYL